MGSLIRVLKDGWNGKWGVAGYVQALLAGMACAVAGWPSSVRGVLAPSPKLQPCHSQPSGSDAASEIRARLSQGAKR